LDTLGHLHLGTFPKTSFSMLTPKVISLLEERAIRHVVLFGIESHVCVLQTALDFLARRYHVHIISDGVSSCNKEEVPLALERMRQTGAQITTSESFSFQMLADSASPNFKAFSALIKEEKERTTKTLQTLSGTSLTKSVL